MRELADDEVSRVGALQTVELTDLGSRFLTHLNDEEAPLEANAPRVLKAGDVLRFPGARMRLRHQPIVLCPSNISQGAKQGVRAAAAKAGAQLAAKWGPMCTHLLVDKEASGTLKVAMAVVEGKPVVDLRWLTEGVLEKREGRPARPLPDAGGPYAAGWAKVHGGVAQLGMPRTQHFKGLRFVFVVPDETEALVRLAGAAGVERAYRWDEAEQADARGTLAAGSGAGGKGNKKPVTVVVDPEQAPTRALVERLARTPGVDAVTSRHAIASSIFSLRPLRDKDDVVVVAAAAPAPAPAPAPAAPEATAAPAAASKGAKAVGKAKAAPAEEGPEEQQKKAAAAAATATTAEPAAEPSPARSTRRSTRCTPAPAGAAEEEVAAPASGWTLPIETPASARATRSRGAAAGAAPGSTPAAVSTTPAASTRKRGRKAVEAEAEKDGVEAEAGAAAMSPARRSKRVAKGKEGEEGQGQQEVAAAMEQEAEAEAAAAAAPVASPGCSAGKRKAPPVAEAEGAAAAGAASQETPSKRGRRGGRGSQGSQPQDDEASIPAGHIPPAPSAAATAAAAASRPFIRQPPPPRPASKPLNPAEGWMVAPHAAPARPAGTAAAGVDGDDGGEAMEEDGAGASQSQTPRSEARGRRRGRAQEEEEDGDEEDGLVDGTTVVEERDLLGAAFGHGGSIFTYYWQPPPGEGRGGSPGAGAGGAGRANGDGRPNFKRFRKNRVRGVTEGAAAAAGGCGPIQPRRRAVVGREDLIAVLPKESEMELRLKYEDEMEQKLKNEAERLFEEEDVGPKRRKR